MASSVSAQSFFLTFFKILANLLILTYLLLNGESSADPGCQGRLRETKRGPRASALASTALIVSHGAPERGEQNITPNDMRTMLQIKFKRTRMLLCPQ